MLNAILGPRRSAARSGVCGAGRRSYRSPRRGKMQVRTGLFAAAVCAWLFVSPGVATAAVLHGFSTTDATLNPDDGYSAAAVTITAAPGVVAPTNGTALGAG